MSELTKEKIYKKELEKVGGEGNNNLERIRSLAGSGTTVVANPELSGDEADLTGLEVDGVKYAVPQGGGVTQMYLHKIRLLNPELFTILFNITTTSNTQLTLETIKNFMNPAIGMEIGCTGVYTDTTPTPIYSMEWSEREGAFIVHTLGGDFTFSSGVMFNDEVITV